MIPEKIIYTDGHNVTVTSSDFKVRNTMYKLNGIVQHGLTRLKANRIPGIILFIIGGVTIKLALSNYFPASWNIELNDTFISSNVFAAWLGVAIALIGTIQIIMERERYAVRIATAEGEKNVVVSKRKEYISQIVDALNEAYRTVDFRPVYHPSDRIEAA
jgi:predicted phage tail protein